VRHFSANKVFTNLGREAMTARNFWWAQRQSVGKNVDSATRNPLLSLSLFGLLSLRAEQR
jgi:hypothetical protein